MLEDQIKNDMSELHLFEDLTMDKTYCRPPIVS